MFLIFGNLYLLVFLKIGVTQRERSDIHER